MKPRIGLTGPALNGAYTTRTEYANAVTLAGGLPFILPYCEDIALILEAMDGILFTGGDDIHPKFLGEEAHPKVSGTNEDRDVFELALCKEAISRNIPIFCICRGMQLLNLCAGGTLIQHIEKHSITQGENILHGVSIEKSSLLSEILGESQQINSRHHQAALKTGPGVIASAHAADGIIEAIEIPSLRFAIGVQWHPEDMLSEHPAQLKLFEAFIKSIL